MLPRDDDALLLLHNPRCSKSREAVALLDARGARYEKRLYLEAPLSRLVRGKRAVIGRPPDAILELLA
jgi:arsenate reductase